MARNKTAVAQVHAALMREAPQAPRDLRASTGLARRTIYTALKELTEEGVVRSTATLRDARLRLYELTPRHAPKTPGRL